MFRKSSLFSLLLMALFGASGCTALLIGGAAAGGYVVGKDERPAAQIIDDSTITASIKTRYAADKYVKARLININTYDGVVTLNGAVSSYVERTQAEAIAVDIIGVKSVVNNLTVTTPN